MVRFIVVLLFVLIISTLGFWYKGCSIESFSINIAGTQIGVYNFSFKQGKIKVNSLTLDIKLKEEPLYEKTEIVPNNLWQLIELIAKAFSLFPVEISVKNLYLKIGNLTTNVYGLSLLKEHFSVDFLEFFDSRGNTLLNLYNGKIYGNYPNYYGNTLFEIKNFKGVCNLNLKLLKRKFVLDILTKKVLISSSFSLRGNKIKVSSEGKSEFVRFWTSGSIFADKVNLKGIINLKTPVEGKLFLNLKGTFDNPNAELHGFLKLCKNFILQLGAVYIQNKVYLSLEEIKNQLYAVGFFKPFSIKGFLGLTTPTDGVAHFDFTQSKIKILIDNLKIKNLCGVSIKNLTSKGVINSKDFTVKGNFEKLTYKKIGLTKQAFSIHKIDSQLQFKLKGSLNGKLLQNKNQFWGFLHGKIYTNGEAFYINLPLVEGNLLKNKRIFKSYINYVKYKAFTVKKVKIGFIDNKKGITINFSDSWIGFLKFQKRDKTVKTKLQLLVWYKDKPLKGLITSTLAPKKGLATVKFPEGALVGKYYRIKELVKGSYKAIWKDISLKGSFLFKNGSLTFDSFLKLYYFSKLLSAYIPFKGEIRKNFLSFRTAPFCVYYAGLYLSCIEKLNFKMENKEISWILKSFKDNSLIFLDITGSLKDNYLNLYSNIGVKTKLLNFLLEKFNTFIAQPKRINVLFTYKGAIKDLLQKVYWNFSQDFLVYSLYFYKPLKVFTSFSLQNGTLLGFVGFTDLSGATPYGTAQIFYPFNGYPKISFDFNSLPLQFFYKDIVDSYLNVDLLGTLFLERSPKLKLNVGLNGFVKVNNYSLPKSEKEQNKNRTSSVDYDARLTSNGPIYIKTPSGYFILTVSGEVRNQKRNLKIQINYGKLNLLGKTFYINSGKVLILNEKTYVELPLTYYAPEKTIYLKIYGYLPWQNLKLEVYSIPPAPREELIMQIVSGGGEGLNSLANISPLSQLLIKSFSFGITGLVNRLTSQLGGNVDISFSPYFDPSEGLVLGVSVKKRFGDFATIGYHWVPSVNPKSTYFWGSVKFLYNSFLRFVRYSDGSISTNIRFMKNWGSPH